MEVFLDREVPMENVQTMSETFSIQFTGKAFDNHDIPASALAQSLLALDGLAKRSAEVIYGKNSNTEIKVKAGFRQGSFIVDLVATCASDPEVAVATVAGGVTIGGGVVATLKGILKLGKFTFGKKVETETEPGADGQVKVTNQLGQVNYFNSTVVNIYNQDRTRSQISRLTQTLDKDGADSIRISTGDDDETAEVIGKQDREFFRYEEGVVLTDNESEVILEIVGPMVNGSPKGWRFCEGGDGGIEFNANVEDADFLAKVKSREIKFENGTSVLAVVRTVQRNNIRTVTERTIVEILEIFSSTQSAS